MFNRLDNCLESQQNREVLVEEVARRLYQQGEILNAEPIDVGRKFKVGFRMMSSESARYAALVLFDVKDTPFGYLTFRVSLREMRCWKACEEFNSLSGVPRAQFHEDKYFGDLYLLARKYRDRNGQDPGIVVGLDKKQEAKYRGKGYGLKLIALALEIAKIMDKEFFFQEPNSRVQSIIETLVTTEPKPSDLSAGNFFAYDEIRRAVYPRFL